MLDPILVVSSTGFVGRQVAVRLRDRNAGVRALVRGGSGRAEAADLIARGIQVVDGDLADSSTLPPMCAGARTIVCTATTMPHGRDDGLRRVDHDGVLNLIDAAERAGVTKFIYLSYSGNNAIDSPLETAKRDCEKRLLDSRMQAIVLRPSFFMEVWLGPHLGFDYAAGTARIFGSGEAGVSYISGFNVADVAVANALAPNGPSEILELGGPEPVSQLQAVRIFENRTGRRFTVQHVPIEALQAQHGSNDPLQKTFAALSLAYANGDVVRDAAKNAERFGVQLRSVDDYAAQAISRH